MIGLRPGATLTLVVPPEFQKTLRGNSPTTELPLPKNETVLVEAQVL